MISPGFKPDKSVPKCLGQCSFTANGCPAAVDVTDGKIVRIRPLHFDDKYTRDQIKPWRIEKNGQFLEPPLKHQMPPYQLAYKKRVFSPNRIRYPLKRVDWDPVGERNSQNRGKSKFKRISWDEAATLIVEEIKRIQARYGPYALLCQGDGHGETKTIHGPHSCQMLLMEKAGGYTLAVRNADSWEGWYWGAEHVWGGEKVQGFMTPVGNILNDITQHTQLLVHIGGDLETTPWGFAGQFPSQACYFWSSIGIKQVFICPDLNYSAAVHADKWIPILPNTDSALLLAIAYIWIQEGTYDKEYVKTHVVGFDKFSDYVLGKEDGVAKTPNWACGKCGIPEWTIKALARDWAAKATSTVHFYGGSYIRGPYSHEPARLECCLLGMQGLGKPGVHQSARFSGVPRQLKDLPLTETFLVNPHDVIRNKEAVSFKSRIWSGRMVYTNPPQLIPKTLVHQAILNPPVSTWGSTNLHALTADQFVKYTYPIPEEKGGTEVHMVWTDNPCRLTCWNNAYKTIEAFRSPKIECIVVQHPWLENDTVFADIILPTNTKLEEEDIAIFNMGGSPYRGLVVEDQAIERVGESLSDYEAVGEVAKKMGLYDQYTDGMSVKEKIKLGFDLTQLDQLISWEEFKEKKYFVVPTAPDWESVPAGLRRFYEDPEKYPLETPTGKLEFYSQRLADAFPDDQERPPSPRWIEKGPSHDERLSSSRARRYPFLMLSNHPRWRTHAQDDDIPWLREIPTCKVQGWDGYWYEPVWLHPRDAARKGIKSGDIVKIFNERGIVLGGATVWERVMPGVIYQDHGARADIISAGPEEYIDRGGAINLIAPANGTSQNCWGMATSGYLADIEKVSRKEMNAWRKKYPESFARDYDPATGLLFESWVTEK
jgi:anaerobic selenocysteine-containing dehydrogenase